MSIKTFNKRTLANSEQKDQQVNDYSQQLAGFF